MSNAASAATAPPLPIGGIPVRNLWLLLLYASDLFRQMPRADRVIAEENPDDIADLVAEILARMVEKRLMRNLSCGHLPQDAILDRVRGRIDLLRTERSQLLIRGKVACRFESLTVNTIQNRHVRGALCAVARTVRRPELGRRCRALATTLNRLGVSGEAPTRAEISTAFRGRINADDQLMLAAAQLALQLVLPTEQVGDRLMLSPGREVTWVRRLFEKAVGGFYDVVLTPTGWRVETGHPLRWPITCRTAGIDSILPAMRTDIILTSKEAHQRLVIDTKFTSILARGWFREEALESSYIYQMYAYLRSQEGQGDAFSDCASGLLLHPSVGEMIDETVTIQAHAIRFATVDLAAAPGEIRNRLLSVCAFPWVLNG